MSPYIFDTAAPWPAHKKPVWLEDYAWGDLYTMNSMGFGWYAELDAFMPTWQLKVVIDNELI